jgi:hypothetical protein
VPSPRPGLLTAGTWDDNLNFDFYQRYLLRESETLKPLGVPAIPRSDRMTIEVKGNDGRPLTGATVTVRAPGRAPFRSITGADGRVLFFPAWAGFAAGESLQINVDAPSGGATIEAVAGEGALAIELNRPGGVTPGLDLAFVIDTTGSMGDEIRYLQAELQTIAGALSREYPGVSRRYALVVYRDDGDAYVVRSFDFTPDLAQFQRSLNQQSAGGGGDTPEAPEQALAAANQLSWRDGPTARVMFWVADAPHHVGREAKMVSAFAGAVGLGVHIYPVAASGTDDLAEFSMRTAAQVTGGRYLFLTDDSRIGNTHKEPRIPCYYVTSLQAAMTRMIETELTGVRIEPAAGEIIRTGGNPEDQRCRLSDGEVVAAF